jgi:hypothetical protein
MEDLHIEPPEEQEQETVFGTVLLRVGTTFLSVFFGFACILLGYMLANVLDLDLREFDANAAVYFSASLVIWIMIGIFTPFTLFQRFFDELKGVSIGRVIAFFLIIGVFIFLHWYIITFITQVLVSIFSAE